jgi:hypothetical protein
MEKEISNDDRSGFVVAASKLQPITTEVMFFG